MKTKIDNQIAIKECDLYERRKLLRKKLKQIKK